MISTASHQLEEVIANAIKKIGCKKENDLCHYLPMPDGYMHHFTLRKMKNHSPEVLRDMIKTFIINVDQPITVAPKQRAARGSRKKKDQIVLTKNDIDRILAMARAVGDKDVIRKFTPKKDIRGIKRDLLNSIRQNKVEQELWLAYVETVNQLPTI
jgi:hypothetical protein